jgi:hypothetical protein
MHTQCIHIAREGFEGDALILDASQPRASALEQSSASSVSAVGLEQTRVVNFHAHYLYTGRINMFDNAYAEYFSASKVG